MHGDDDPGAVHLAALDDGTVVGACVLLPATYPLRPEVAGSWQLRGMATVAARRNEGIGALLLTAAVGEVRARGGRLLWCQARDSAIRFYARHGFLGEGEHFVQAETGIMHQLMYRELAGVFDSSDVVS
jgi:GNAT superfamily N-acetyltransferase